MVCPACSESSGDELRGSIAFCSACGHRWLVNSADAHRAVEESVYTDDYAGYRPDPIFSARVADFVRAQLVGRIPPPATVLDVGCGSGDFMAAMAPLGYEVEGIDISEASARFCRNKGLAARAGDFLTVDFGRTFDLIAMWDVIEHLRNPGAFFDRAQQLLSPGGYFLAKVPSFGDLSVRISNIAPRTAGMLLGAPNHVQYFDSRSLGVLLDRHGFRHEWLPRVAGGMRARPRGGALKRRLARSARALIKRWSGDNNLYFLAQPR